MEAEMKQYSRHGQHALLDRVRKQLVEDGPEEGVRQKFVNGLIDHYKVPTTMIDTEYSLSRTHAGKKQGSKERPDIIIWETGKNKKALLLVETKEPRKSIDDGEALEQVMRYVKLVPARYVIITNGTGTRSYRVERLCPVEISDDLVYADLSSYSGRSNNVEGEPMDFGEDTPDGLHPVISDLHDFLLSHEFGSHLPAEHHGLLVREDLGHAYREYGNASGGVWPGWYRVFIVRDLHGDDQTYCISIMPQKKTRDDPKYKNRRGTTKLLVAVDDFELKPHNALQIRLDDSLSPSRTGYSLTHDGTKSRTRKEEVMRKVSSLAPGSLAY
jgi:hypothetical protein